MLIERAGLTNVLPVVQEGQHDLQAGAASLVQHAVQRLPGIVVIQARPVLRPAACPFSILPLTQEGVQ